MDRSREKFENGLYLQYDQSRFDFECCRIRHIIYSKKEG